MFSQQLVQHRTEISWTLDVAVLNVSCCIDEVRDRLSVFVVSTILSRIGLFVCFFLCRFATGVVSQLLEVNMTIPPPRGNEKNETGARTGQNLTQSCCLCSASTIFYNIDRHFLTLVILAFYLWMCVPACLCTASLQISKGW